MGIWQCKRGRDFLQQEEVWVYDRPNGFMFGFCMLGWKKVGFFPEAMGRRPTHGCTYVLVQTIFWQSIGVIVSAHVRLISCCDILLVPREECTYFNKDVSSYIKICHI